MATEQPTTRDSLFNKFVKRNDPIFRDSLFAEFIGQPNHSLKNLALTRFTHFMDTLFGPSKWELIGDKIKLLGKEREFRELNSSLKGNDPDFTKLMKQSEQTLYNFINSSKSDRFTFLRIISKGNTDQLPLCFLIVITLLAEIMDIYGFHIDWEGVIGKTYGFSLEHQYSGNSEKLPELGNLLPEGKCMGVYYIDPSFESNEFLLKILLDPLEYFKLLQKSFPTGVSFFQEGLDVKIKTINNIKSDNFIY